jgi:hypothetical protein
MGITTRISPANANPIATFFISPSKQKRRPFRSAVPNFTTN